MMTEMDEWFAHAACVAHQVRDAQALAFLAFCATVRVWSGR